MMSPAAAVHIAHASGTSSESRHSAGTGAGVRILLATWWLLSIFRCHTSIPFTPSCVTTGGDYSESYVTSM
jgi:hypothetical protein